MSEHAGLLFVQLFNNLLCSACRYHWDEATHTTVLTRSPDERRRGQLTLRSDKVAGDPVAIRVRRHANNITPSMNCTVYYIDEDDAAF